MVSQILGILVTFHSVSTSSYLSASFLFPHPVQKYSVVRHNNESDFHLWHDELRFGPVYFVPLHSKESVLKNLRSIEVKVFIGLLISGM